MTDTRERCVECGHFICPDTAPSPPAPGEVLSLESIAEQLERQVASAAMGADLAVRVSDPAHLIASLRQAATALAALTSRLEAAEKERDETRAKYQELIRSANGYGPALAQQDRRIEELESKCERLISSCERTESERDEAKRARDAAVEIAIDAVTMSGLVDNVPPGSGWQQRIRDYCAAQFAILNKGKQP